MAKKPITFRAFFFLPDGFYKSIGLVAYNQPGGNRLAALLQCFFTFSMISMNTIWIAEIIFVLISLAKGDRFLESTMNVIYINFVFVANIKILSFWRNKALLHLLMDDLVALYPQDLQQQGEYGVRRYWRRYMLEAVCYGLINLVLVWCYNLFAGVNYLIYDYWLHVRHVPVTLPYHVWLPWDWHDHWSYYLLYVMEIITGHTCMSAQIANDLLLCMVAIQVIMHYHHLADTIEAYQARHSWERDSQFLIRCIESHQRILHLSESMNKVFGVILLVNFISSSFILCLLGFQITADFNSDSLFMLVMFLFCSLLQLYIICKYGQELIETSERIGHAVFNHEWYAGDLRYKKLMILIIKRAQKPALLQATPFLNVSLGTLTDLLQISYKFFALLRTMYTK